MLLVFRKFFLQLCLILCVVGGMLTSMSLRMGGVVPADFPESNVPESQLTFESWRTYSSMEWLRLSQKMQAMGHTDLAEKALLRAWERDLSDGGVVGAMIGLRANKGSLEHFNDLAELAEVLWPQEFAEMRRQRLGLPEAKP